MKKRGKSSKTKKKDLSTIIILLVVVVVGMSVAYAALYSTLTISVSKITQSSLSWNVGFQTGTVNATVGGSGNDGRSCGQATVTANSVTVANTQLSKPDDSCTYTLVVKNTGSIDATLGTITASDPTSVSCTKSGASMVCGNITYKLTTDASGNNLLTTGGTLAKSTGSQTIYLVMKFTGSSIVSSEQSQSNAGFTLVYNQA